MKLFHILLSCILIFLVFFITDYTLYSDYQPYIGEPLALHDITSNVYSVELSKNNLSVAVYDPDNLWGEGSFLLHSFFLKNVARSYKGIKICISFFNAIFAIIIFILLLLLTQSHIMSLLATFIMIGCLSANNFICGPGYATYYSFIFNFISILLFIFYTTSRERTYILFILGALIGISYGFKFEIASTSALTYFLIIIFDNLFFDNKTNNNCNSLIINTFYIGIIIFFTFLIYKCSKYGFFILAIMPILTTTFFLILNKNICFNFNRRLFINLFYFIIGFLFIVTIWIIRLSRFSDINYAIMFYFPFLRLDNITAQLRNHNINFGIMGMLDRAMYGHKISYRDTFLVFTFISALYFYLKKRNILPRFNIIALLALLSLFSSLFVHHHLYTHRPFFELYLLILFVFLLIVKHKIKLTPILQSLLILLSGQFLIFLREPNCAAYESWNILPTSLLIVICLLYTFDYLSYSYKNIGILLFLVLIVHSSSTISYKYIADAPLFKKNTFSYSKTLNLNIYDELAVEFNKMEDFFTENLRTNDTIFVFSSVKLPYIAAKRFLPKMLPSFDKIATPEKEEILLNHFKNNKNSIKYVVLHADNSVQFSGDNLKNRYSLLFEYINSNYHEHKNFWKFMILKRIEP
ncbi:MAG: hypothetical protein A2306_06420 [Omnitrophica WOR_2 bacterium RIFOXYB2_FULL_38_16]|nr:MAG: hypothetical protein A2306_06420 [Omnitrophica WOR_2 bacterium RIFOXYB2_FULL_38_16]